MKSFKATKSYNGQHNEQEVNVVEKKRGVIVVRNT